MNATSKAVCLFKTVALIVLLAGCKKDDWVSPIDIGSKFNYEGTKFLTKPDGETPENPFTVDSVVVAAYSSYNGYWVSSANGLTYVMDPLAIRKGLIKQTQGNN